MRIVRRSLLLVASLSVAVPVSAGVAGAQLAPDLTISVRKVVVGTGAPSTVTLSCRGATTDGGGAPTAFLNFDAHGAPTTALPESDWEIVDGAWAEIGVNSGGGNCLFEETTTGGATSTSWTCAYTSEPAAAPAGAAIPEGGCDAAAGTGTGTARVVYADSDAVSEQASTVTFTNTFTPLEPIQPIRPAASVVAQPAFTG